MKLDLTELLQSVGNEADVNESEKVSFPEDQLILTRPVELELHLVNTGSSVLARGRIRTEAELECGRCLKTYKQPLNVEVEEEFLQNGTAFSGKGEIELKAEDFAYPIEKDNSLDLTEFVRQNLLLSLPIKTLCDPDCKGV